VDTKPKRIPSFQKIIMKKYSSKFVLLAAILLFLSSCANFKMHQSDDAKKWKNQHPNSNATISHTIFLIGDTGDADVNVSNPTLSLLKKQLGEATKNSSVLFLGNNVYPRGVPPKKNQEERQDAEISLDQQLDLLDDFQGRPIFMPGNRDWNRYGLKGVKRQEKYIESALNKGIEEEDDWSNYFLPDNACPGPEIVEINEDLVIIIIDSEWWLRDWDEEPNVNDGCEVKSREAFALLVEAAIKDHKNKNIVFAAHHPFKSYGPHGSRFTAKEHIFPLTPLADDLFLPLPGLGSLIMSIRGAGIFRQDLANRLYKELSKAVIGPAKKNGEFIFVSGHENSLQYIQSKGQHFIVSGAGAKKTAVAKGPGTMFSYGHMGFSKIDFYEDGSAWVEFWIPGEQGNSGQLVFRYKMKGALEKTKAEEIPTTFPDFDNRPDSLLTFPSSREIKPMKKFSTFMLGERRRALYQEQYNFPVLDLSTFRGGTTVVKKGGGKQTNSLRLLAADGNEYVMRSLTKDVTRGVPYPFNKLPYVSYLFSETFLGSHPFAPLTLPTLAKAANIYHTNPGIYHIPKQPALGVYNDNFGGEVYLVEERASKSWPEADFFGNAEKFINSYKLGQKLEKNHKHRVDQKWVARSRLFDLLIGDFDRHGDQWRWTVTPTDKGYKLYRPVPRDRDNAYGTYDGFAMKLLKPYHSLVRQLGTYNNDVGDFKWNYYNARHFDHNFLNEMSLDDWKKEAKYIQENVSDEVIEKAIAYLPAKAYKMTGMDIKAVLRARRDNLQNIAEGFYKQLARRSIVHGTDKKEYFEVIRKDDEHTEISMYATNKKGEKKERLYHRIFKTSETKEVYMYGLGGHDIFHISGEVDKSIKLQIVGGLGKDEFIDVSKVSGLGRKDHFYDSIKGNKLSLGSEGKDKTSDVAKNNVFERLGTQFDESVIMPIPLLGFNAGDGFKIGFMGIYHFNKFNKDPFGQQHVFGVNYSFRTGGVDVFYNNVFFEAAKHWDLVMNTELRSNRYAFNYFGIGNETVQEKDDLDFYFVQQSQVYFDIGFQRRFAGDIGLFSFRPLVQGTKVRDTENRFVDQEDNGLDAKDFESRWYAGITGDLSFESVDNEISPRDGFRFKNHAGWQKSISGSNRNFTTYGSEFTLYKSFLKRRNLTFATRLGTEIVRGDYDFFFTPALGEDENIRGLFGQRFRGATNFFHTTDLRLGLGGVSNSILPFSFGITASFDYGRVWEPDEDSDVWHRSFGGGIWLVPLNLAIISFTYNVAKEDQRFAVTLGHAF